MNSLCFDDPALLDTIVRPQALAEALRMWGVTVVSQPETAVSLVCDDRKRPGKVLRLLPSWLDGHWRIAEEHGAGDARPSRIARRHGAALDPATIHAAASSFPDPPCDRSPVRGYAGDSETWRALASGLEIAVEGDGGLLPSGLCHTSVSGPGRARLNARDATRKWLASDLLFSAAPAEPKALAWLIADALAWVDREQPRVSIVINNHNYADYLGAAIESALGQALPAHEVIVVDDGSTDGSREVVAAYPGIRTVEKPNAGQGSAFNAGFEAASGDLIVFLDADDRLLPDAVAVLRDQDLDGIARLSFGLETIDGTGRRTGLFPTSRLADGGVLGGRLLRQGFLQMMPTSGNAFPRSTLESLLPMPEAPWRTSADVYLVFGAAFLGRTRHLDMALGQYRVHGRNAYHATFGAEAQYNPRKLAQRRQAFGDITGRMERMPALGTPRDAAALRSMAQPGSILRRFDAWRSDILSPRARLAMPPLSDGRRAPPPQGRLRRHLAESDPARLGGMSGWPCLGPGERLDLTTRPTETPLGDGWSWEPGAGATLSSGWGVIACQVPGPRADWRIQLHHRAAHPGRISVWVNGTRLDDLRSDEAGSACLDIGSDLLVPDPQTRTWRLGITLVPDAEASLTLTALAARRILPAVTGAPVLRPGPTVRPDDATGRRVLAEGWDWPDDAGARMAKAEAILRFSAAEAGRLVLHVDVDPLPMMVSVQGEAVAVIPDAGGRGVHVPLPSGLIPDTGELAVGLLAPDGVWPRLRSLRLSRASEGGDALPPGQVVPLGDLARHEAFDGTITISLGATEGDPLRLVFDQAEDAPTPRRADLTLDGRSVAVMAAGPGEVAVATGAPVRHLTCRTTDTLRLTGVARVPPTARNPTSPAAPALDAGALHESALSPDAWIAADGDALWLASQRAELSIARPPGGAAALRASVLVLPGVGQTLTLRLGAAETRTTGAEGMETLTLPLPDGDLDAPLRLIVETDALVEAAALGVDMPGLLGGALIRVDFGGPDVPGVEPVQTEDAV